MSKFFTSCVQWGDNILYRGYENGRRVHLKTPFQPTLYIKSSEGDMKSLYGDRVSPMTFPSIKEAKEFTKRYEDVDNFPIFGMQQYQYQYLANKFPGDIEFSIDDMVVSVIDIETASEEGFPDPVTANEEILLVSRTDRGTGKNTVWGSRPYEKQPGDQFDYVLCKNEIDLLTKFIVSWQTNYPDILTGWNTTGYDIPYLVNRIRKLLGEDALKKMSPWGIIKENSKTVQGKPVVTWDLVGVVHLDYLELYKKYTYSSRESYALGFIASTELGTTKLELEGSFRDAYSGTFIPNLETFVPKDDLDNLFVLRANMLQEIQRRKLKV